MIFLLDLVRHGEALQAAEGGDALRRLSDAGRETIGRLAGHYAREASRPGAIFTSPLARARETADLLCEALPALEPAVLDELIPDGEPADLVAALSARDLPGHVILVGHQPLLGRLVAFLASGREAGFPAGALVRLEFPGALAARAGVIQLELPPSRTR